ncbi:hypothetical protein [Pseudomonas sp. BE134]|uniref:hypothetical protein n=1 Tax=Pseudomonas sp. BE134 TaxID=2817843 RepID=UPI00285B4EEA|nr:hypothetical protein [Pseudomonas sp. BE134]MDR6927861.1 hypothetical protein [Pseudomonas sp. BE134]
MITQKKPPSIRTCSRFFQPEYDMVSKKNGELKYTVYAAPQRFSEQLEMQELGLQRFAILWDKNPQYEIFELIDRALVSDLLSPVSMLHLSPEKLTIIATLPKGKNADVISFTYDRRWKEYPLKTQWQSWELQRLGPDDLLSLETNSVLRLNGPHILSTENFGVYAYEEMYFAFKDIEL